MIRTPCPTKTAALRNLLLTIPAHNPNSQRPAWQRLSATASFSIVAKWFQILGPVLVRVPGLCLSLHRSAQSVEKQRNLSRRDFTATLCAKTSNFFSYSSACHCSVSLLPSRNVVSCKTKGSVDLEAERWLVPNVFGVLQIGSDQGRGHPSHLAAI
jgi:hypothetical protein